MGINIKFVRFYNLKTLNNSKHQMTDQEDYDLVDMTTTGTKIAEDSPNYE